MGNQNSRESRAGDRSSRYGNLGPLDAGPFPGVGGPSQNDQPPSGGRRESRQFTGLLGLTSSSSGGGSRDGGQQHERRETKQEREARRMERERLARIEERERSMKEEHVDGGYLVTLGTYSQSEDFNKPIVRQLQVRHASGWIFVTVVCCSDARTC